MVTSLKKAVVVSLILTICICSPIIYVIENQPEPEPELILTADKVLPVIIDDIYYIPYYENLSIPRGFRISLSDTRYNSVLLTGYVENTEWNFDENYTVGMGAYITARVYTYQYCGNHSVFNEVRPIEMFYNSDKALHAMYPDQYPDPRYTEAMEQADYLRQIAMEIETYGWDYVISHHR